MWLVAGAALAGVLAAAPSARAASGPAAAPAPTSTTPAQTPAAAASDGSLTAFGVTLYGSVDVGLVYVTHGAPVGDSYGPGEASQIQKYSNRSAFTVAPNGISSSKIGLSGLEPLNADTAVVFRLETSIQPTTGQLTDGLKSLVANNGKPLNQQISSADASKAGQPLENAAYVGLDSKTFGTLTFGRQTGLLPDVLGRYDPQASAPAFSILGYSGLAAGGEDGRMDSTVKYALHYKFLRLALLHQFGTSGSVPGGADAVDVGGDLAGLSVDATYNHFQDLVSASSLTAAQSAAAPGTLAATVSDMTAWSAQARYAFGPAKLYAGYEHLEYADPKHPLAAGQEDIGGYVLSVVNNTAFVHEKVLQISWVGLRYSLTKALDLTGAYYHYEQNSYKGNGCDNRSAVSCRGGMNEVSLAADYRLVKRFDVYAGVNYSNVVDGLASGYLKTTAFSEMAGVRFSF